MCGGAIFLVAAAALSRMLHLVGSSSTLLRWSHGAMWDVTAPRRFVRVLWGNRSGRLYVSVHTGVSIPIEGR